MVDDPLGEAQCTAAGFGQLTRRLWNLAAELAKGWASMGVSWVSLHGLFLISRSSDVSQ